ncbi:MAG: UbiX family flavin prenyltransferase [Chloroflexi bacterium]|jgi:flavin prenyltransferase|nr:UbiX family flavin prenyltransferase [Chloroflexota bacterium]MBT7080398.1 UbiX family flavin prenyltransferase [Chloroflexota bacterium]MBT7289229.1 UbiX family flavin prenyltransferase [Chloroflexota bacterium]
MIVVAITGASGSILGVRLIEQLLACGDEVAGIVSEKAWPVIAHELVFQRSSDLPLTELLKGRGVVRNFDLFKEFDDGDLSSAIASGSSQFEAAVVMPCSMKTLSAIANGYADTLITRTCDVAIKEKRACIIVPRETPLSLIHIENMRKAALAGVSIVPPVPGFYAMPKTIDDVVDFVVGKVLTLLGREHTLFKSWGDDSH